MAFRSSWLGAVVLGVGLLAMPARAADVRYPVIYGYYPGYVGDGFYTGYWGSRHGWTNFPYGRYDYGLNYYGDAPTTVRYPAYEGPGGFAPLPGVPAALEAPPADNAAHLRVRVAPGADLWFDGVQTLQTGVVREFTSPALTPGRNYTYTVRARWTEDGYLVDRTRTIRVRANLWAEVDMTEPESRSTAAP